MSAGHTLLGRWWTPQGIVGARCHHEEGVLQQLTVDAAWQQDSAPLFLPAPVDLHVHGGGGSDCMEGEAAIRCMLDLHAAHGTGALLATSVTAGYDEIEHFIEAVSAVMQAPDATSATLLGAHLEGPFINPEKLGAQPPMTRALDLERLERWLRSGVVRVITYAPELDPGQQVPSLCRRYGVRAQLGHSNCRWQQAQLALSAGVGVTHLFNAMSGVSHRHGGAAAAALAWAEYAELIADGLHVDQAAFALARRAIPKLYAVSDATAATGMPDGEFRLGSHTVIKCGNAVRLADGTLAGSCATARHMIGVLREWGLDWHAIGFFTSAIPAQWIGARAHGSLAIGARADWLEIRHEVPVALWLAGVRRELAD